MSVRGKYSELPLALARSPRFGEGKSGCERELLQRFAGGFFDSIIETHALRHIIGRESQFNDQAAHGTPEDGCWFLGLVETGPGGNLCEGTQFEGFPPFMGDEMAIKIAFYVWFH